MKLPSAGIYIPFEIYELMREVTVLRIGILLCNIILVAYLSRVLATQIKRRRANGSREPPLSL